MPTILGKEQIADLYELANNLKRHLIAHRDEYHKVFGDASQRDVIFGHLNTLATLCFLLMHAENITLSQDAVYSDRVVAVPDYFCFQSPKSKKRWPRSFFGSSSADGPHEEQMFLKVDSENVAAAIHWLQQDSATDPQDATMKRDELRILLESYVRKLVPAIISHSELAKIWLASLDFSTVKVKKPTRVAREPLPEPSDSDSADEFHTTAALLMVCDKGDARCDYVERLATQLQESFHKQQNDREGALYRGEVFNYFSRQAPQQISDLFQIFATQFFAIYINQIKHLTPYGVSSLIKNLASLVIDSILMRMGGADFSVESVINRIFMKLVERGENSVAIPFVKLEAHSKRSSDWTLEGLLRLSAPKGMPESIASTEYRPQRYGYRGDVDFGQRVLASTKPPSPSAEVMLKPAHTPELPRGSEFMRRRETRKSRGNNRSPVKKTRRKLQFYGSSSQLFHSDVIGDVSSDAMREGGEGFSRSQALVNK